MAYFETLGQLQSNDESFVPIYNHFQFPSGAGTYTETITNSKFGLEIGDIILIVISGGHSSSTVGVLNNIVISGSAKIFENAFSSTISGYNNRAYLYIGKVTDNSVIATFYSIYNYANAFVCFRLAPR